MKIVNDKRCDKLTGGTVQCAVLKAGNINLGGYTLINNQIKSIAGKKVSAYPLTTGPVPFNQSQNSSSSTINGISTPIFNTDESPEYIKILQNGTYRIDLYCETTSTTSPSLTITVTCSTPDVWGDSIQLPTVASSGFTSTTVPLIANDMVGVMIAGTGLSGNIQIVLKMQLLFV